MSGPHKTHATLTIIITENDKDGPELALVMSTENLEDLGQVVI